MSYAQAMKWGRTHHKGTHQPVIMSTGSGPWPSGWSNPLVRPLLEIRLWYPRRNDGDKAERQHTRECLRESIADAKANRQTEE